MTETAPQDATLELAAMKAVLEALSRLEPAQAKRVLRWAGEVVLGVSDARPELQRSEGGNVEAAQTFGSVAELHAGTAPETDADRALVTGYWVQFVQGAPDFSSQQINALLKDLGHRITNITGAFSSLKSRKPSLVVQLKKAGTARQARKTYKLTTAGKQAVEAMMDQHQV
jgi:hypothetical protein